MILAERTARLDAEARAQSAETLMSSARLEIKRLKLLLAKARRAQYGQSSERRTKIIAQLGLQLVNNRGLRQPAGNNQQIPNSKHLTIIA